MLKKRIHVVPNLYSEMDIIVVEIFTHIGYIKVELQHELSQDILKSYYWKSQKASNIERCLLLIRKQKNI